MLRYKAPFVKKIFGPILLLLMLFLIDTASTFAQCPRCQLSEVDYCVLWYPGRGRIFVSTGGYFSDQFFIRYRTAWANAGNNWSAVQGHLQLYEEYPSGIFWQDAYLGPDAAAATTSCRWTLPDSYYAGCTTTINDSTAPAGSTPWLQALAAHEFGHSLSLNDSNDFGCFCTTIMYGFVPDPPCITGPTGADVNMINYLYEVAP